MGGRGAQTWLMEESETEPSPPRFVSGASVLCAMTVVSYLSLMQPQSLKDTDSVWISLCVSTLAQGLDGI